MEQAIAVAFMALTLQRLWRGVAARGTELVEACVFEDVAVERRAFAYCPYT